MSGQFFRARSGPWTRTTAERGTACWNGTPAGAIGTAVHLILLRGPAFLAIGISLFFAAGTARSLRARRL